MRNDIEIMQDEYNREKLRRYNERYTSVKRNVPEKTQSKGFFYFTRVDKFTICDLGLCAESERTIDIQLFNLANDEDLLHLFQLYYKQRANNDIERAEGFCGYLASFKNDNELANQQYEHSIQNPMVRILFMDDSMLESAKTILNIK